MTGDPASVAAPEAPAVVRAAPGWERGRAILRAGLTPILVVLVLVAGALLRASGSEDWAHVTWLAGMVAAGAPIVWRTLRGVLAGHFAADIVASLSIVGAAVLGEPLAGLVIVLMQSGGEALEQYAAGRASEAVRELEAAAPRVANRVEPDGTVRTVVAETIAVGDRLLVRPGELVPCNVVVLEGRSHVDASRLTGEPVPVSAQPGTPLLSGSVNGEGALTVRATAVAAESEYAKIVELVRAAQGSKAPLQRAADRYAVWFTPVTLLACAVAYLASGDPARVLAVLVVATPCPLLLATPVAIIGGISRAARRGVIVRHGAALEHLAQVRTAVFDKTGTMTIGRPRVRDVQTLGRVPAAELLRLAAGVEQGSSHLLARSVVEAAERAGPLPSARHVTEDAGRGVVGEVDGRRVMVGSRSLLEARGLGAGGDFGRLEAGDAQLRAYVAVDGVLEGAIEFADAVRDAAPAMLRELKACGVRKSVMLSGDSAANTAAVARALGIDEARGDLLPADKVATVRELTRGGAAVAMIGDGTNDAPALAAATVGIALASHGGGISAEAADVVILTDDVGRVAEAVRIGRRTMRVARQSIWVGLGLSAAAMVVAAFGMIPPATGALLQEAIDVAVILNALRTSRAPRASDVNVIARPRPRPS